MVTIFLAQVLAIPFKINKVGGVFSHETQSINYAKACVKPGYNYFNTEFGTGGDLEVAVSVSNERYFDPVQIVAMKPNATDIDNLSMFPFLLWHAY